jgi:hypothetical protein
MIAYPKSLVGRMGHINETCGNRGMLHPASSKELKAYIVTPVLLAVPLLGSL